MLLFQSLFLRKEAINFLHFLTNGALPIDVDWETNFVRDIHRDLSARYIVIRNSNHS